MSTLSATKQAIAKNGYLTTKHPQSVHRLGGWGVGIRAMDIVHRFFMSIDGWLPSPVCSLLS